MKFQPALLLSTLLVLAGVSARAEDTNMLFGTPLVADQGYLMLQGHQITLWGIDTLADDQQCWQGGNAWRCGEQAAESLKHFAEGQLVKCQIKENFSDGRIGAQCFRDKGGKPNDIAAHLVRHGWAMDRPESSGGLYGQDQEEARLRRRGIWTSRFQTAADWRNGIQRFVEYEQAPEPAHQLPAPVITSAIVVPVPVIGITPSRPHHGGHDHDHDYDKPPHKPEPKTPKPASNNPNAYENLQERLQQQESRKPVGSGGTVYDQLDDRLRKQP